ncbi:3-hydroxyacyl-CoA dehydrogenase family protein [Fulvivirga imtechensis]|nr:3-hydroxyacyl-CoA dehydrogenase family protein [Fulvivirga imtechensis]
MKILIIGEEENFKEFREKFSDNHEYTFLTQLNSPKFLNGKDLVFDFKIDETPDNFEFYKAANGTVIFLNTVKISLTELNFFHGSVKDVYGFNGLPTFLNREIVELSTIDGKKDDRLVEIFSALQSKFEVVEDRVGMVTPRIIFMIINEAYYTVQEGTASKKDIDLGMKLGTNYPYGPFEWIEKIGIHHVYETLEAIYEDTKDERYKICPLLKKEYMLLTI